MQNKHRPTVVVVITNNNNSEVVKLQCVALSSVVSVVILLSPSLCHSPLLILCLPTYQSVLGDTHRVNPASSFRVFFTHLLWKNTHGTSGKKTILYEHDLNRVEANQCEKISTSKAIWFRSYCLDTNIQSNKNIHQTNCCKWTTTGL